MGMYDPIDRLVNLYDEVIESDSPGLRQKVVARYMTAFGNIIERETGTAVKLALADLRFAAEEKDERGFCREGKGRARPRIQGRGARPHSRQRHRCAREVVQRLGGVPRIKSLANSRLYPSFD